MIIVCMKKLMQNRVVITERKRTTESNREKGRAQYQGQLRPDAWWKCCWYVTSPPVQAIIRAVRKARPFWNKWRVLLQNSNVALWTIILWSKSYMSMFVFWIWLPQCHNALDVFTWRPNPSHIPLLRVVHLKCMYPDFDWLHLTQVGLPTGLNAR